MTTQDNSVDANELEAALAHMKQMQNDQLAAPPPRYRVRICQFVRFLGQNLSLKFSKKEGGASGLPRSAGHRESRCEDRAF